MTQTGRRYQTAASSKHPAPLKSKPSPSFLAISVFATGAFLGTPPAYSHPHIFVDGGVDFRFENGTLLDALEVTWLYDEFETLYILSSYGLGLNAQGGLDEADRLELVQRRSEWPSDFDGSAHIAFAGERLLLEWPSDLDVDLVDGRLKVTFLRQLATPIDLSGNNIEVAFYESTYFFAFAVTQAPQLLGEASTCMQEVNHFDPDAQDTKLQATLAKLGREEMPDIPNVGSFFADRIIVRCE